jgi:hypothetical protein
MDHRAATQAGKDDAPEEGRMNMAAMTAQEIFDKVTTHLLTQMKQSRNSNSGGCVYRSPDGLMCALGCLIEDSEYTPTMEVAFSSLMTSGKCPQSLMDRLGIIPEPTFNEFGGNYYLLNQLQYIHDANQPEDWRDQLNKLAALMKLQFNPPDQK